MKFALRSRRPLTFPQALLSSPPIVSVTRQYLSQGAGADTVGNFQGKWKAGRIEKGIQRMKELHSEIERNWLPDKRKSSSRPTPRPFVSLASSPHRLFTTATTLMRTAPTGCNLGILDDRDGGILCLLTGSSRSRGLRACGSVFEGPGDYTIATTPISTRTITAPT
ncbi:hypothetical protein B0H65DRAFT_109989 [Neurospora tetraspora]|uniref:Uncharacterized protein n=1 Tax=Neurospora tetraspora TaxID=94610 RepID=A0AAE0MU56_9PEZI|nr:hypothetical protein B0H65DRAFT_109989 [Neurospora tetraspora]